MHTHTIYMHISLYTQHACIYRIADMIHRYELLHFSRICYHSCNFFLPNFWLNGYLKECIEAFAKFNPRKLFQAPIHESIIKLLYTAHSQTISTHMHIHTSQTTHIAQRILIQCNVQMDTHAHTLNYGSNVSGNLLY